MANRTATIVIEMASMRIAMCGAAVVIVLGSDSSMSTGHQQVSSSSAALVAPIDNIDATNGVSAVLGRPELRLSVRGAQRDVFIGVGPTRAVQRYLAGAGIDRIEDMDLDPFHLNLEHRPGTVWPATPAAQMLWVAKSSVAAASLYRKVRNGDYRIVVMTGG